MKMMDFAKSVAGLLLAPAFLLTGCADDEVAVINPPVKENRILPLAELKGVWDSEVHLFDLEKDGVCYELDLSYGPPYYDGYVHDENGNYVTVKTSEYCRQYAEDYNADPANADMFTADDAASRTLAESYVCRFTITDDQFLFEQGNAAGVSITIRGTYTYDEETGLFTVTKDYGDNEVSLVYALEDADGVVRFLVMSEWYAFYLATYDGSKEYFMLCPVYYLCGKGSEK